jgi:choline kinase/protein-L-isoaspartate O-methyltransferase
MKAIILAAGEGSRLGKIAKGRPKCLIDIEDNTLLEIQINTLHDCGIENISIVRGYHGELIDIPGLTYYENDDYAKTNMLHSLFCAQEELTEDILILYSDIIFEEGVIKRIIESRDDVSIGVLVNWQEALEQRNKPSLEDLEMVYFDAENRVQNISKNLTDEYATKGQFIGIVKCTARGTEVLKRNYFRAKSCYFDKPFGQSDSFEKAWLTDLLQEMSEIGVPLHCTIIERGWMEIDTPEDYDRVLKDTNFVRSLVKTKTDWDHRAKLYNRLEWTSKDELLDSLVEMTKVQPGMKVLDVGTGTGKILFALSKLSQNATYFGIDISQGMLDKMGVDHNFKLSVGKIENLVFEENTIDLVTARMVIHHANNLKNAMSEFHRVLKKGGRFVVCEGNPPDLSSLSFYREMFRFKEDRLSFVLDDLVNLLLTYGFRENFSKLIL